MRRSTLEADKPDSPILWVVNPQPQE